MLNTIREYWNAVIKSCWFLWFVVIFVVTLYCNLGWAWGYVICNIESVPSWIHFLADPYSFATKSTVYDLGSQTIGVILGPIFWIVEWIVYLFSLVLGGIAKILIVG
jgi:hypothetical protein